MKNYLYKQKHSLPMKLLVIKYDDGVDTSILPKGTTVSVSDGGQNTLPNGVVMSSVDMLEQSMEGDYHIAPV